MKFWKRLFKGRKDTTLLNCSVEELRAIKKEADELAIMFSDSTRDPTSDDILRLNRFGQKINELTAKIKE